jgi:hypothetical protein
MFHHKNCMERQHGVPSRAIKNVSPPLVLLLPAASLAEMVKDAEIPVQNCVGVLWT